MVSEKTGKAWRIPVLVLLLAVPPVLSPAAEPVTGELPPRLSGLLRQEMRAINGAMQAIFQGIVTGDHARVERKARKIHQSFILEKELTPEDRQRLKEAAPKAFLRLDRGFHEDAAALARAAGEQDSERELELFREMSRACVDCHTRFTGDRFPGLTGP